MIAKTLSGVSILDEQHGGVFSNRSFLVTGAKDTGKTVMGLQFIKQGLEQSDRCLYLSTMVADDLGILAESLGFQLSYYIESEALTLLEYETFMTGSGAPGLDMLPPEGFDQLRDIIHTNSIERVALDTVLPWVSVQDSERMSQQVFSFVRSLDRLGVTSMLTLPKPVSTLAFKLKKSIEDVVPVSILLQASIQSDPATFQVVKYLGEQRLGGKIPYRVKPGTGICERSSEDISLSQPSSTPVSPNPDSAPKETPDAKRARFSSVRFDPASRQNQPPGTPANQQTEGDHPEKPSDQGDSGTSLTKKSSASNNVEEPEVSEAGTNDPSSGAAGVRLSSIWKPQPETGSTNNPSS